jgi:hypothetical protein
LGFEPEITVKIAKRRLRIYEVGISYYGRSYEEGKKIGWKDGFRALWCLLKYSLRESPVSVRATAPQNNNAVATPVSNKSLEQNAAVLKRDSPGNPAGY